MSATFDHLGTTLESKIRCCKARPKARLCQQEVKSRKLFSRTMQSFLGLFASGGLRTISFIIALNVHNADAKYDRRSMADIQMWPEALDDNTVTQWTETLS